MKKKLTHNLGMKILSVVLAAFAWLMIMNAADPVVSGSFNGIPVRVKNDEVITSRGYQYSIESGEKVDIRVRGKRSVVDHLTEADFVATADFNSLNSLYMVAISVDCLSEHSSDLAITLRTENMAVKLEDQETLPFGIKVVQVAEVKEGYYCYENKPESSLVQVTGSKTQMAKVKEIVAVVDVEGESASFSANCDLVAYDDKGEEIDLQKLVFSQDSVDVSVGICPAKEVEIEVVTKNKPANGYFVEKIEYAPKTVLIAAEESLLKTIDSIEIPCDVFKAYSNVEARVNLQEFLDNTMGAGVYVVDSNTVVAIVATIAEMSEKRIEISVDKIEVRNLREGLLCNVYSIWNSNILVKGPRAELEKLTVDDLKPYIDMTGYGTGTFSKELMYTLESDLLIEKGTVQVYISEIAPEE